MAVTEDRTIRLDRDALSGALAPGGAVAPPDIVLDTGRQMLRAPGGVDGAVREFSGAGLAVLMLRHLSRLKVPVPKDASKRVVVGEDDVALVLHRTHPLTEAPPG